MSWPKHNYGFIVLGPWGGPVADNGQGMFVERNFAEVFLDRKVAEWIRREWQKNLREWGAIQKPGQQASYEESAKRIRIIRVALPGTYPQARIPDRLERALQKEHGIIAVEEFLKLGRRL